MRSLGAALLLALVLSACRSEGGSPPPQDKPKPKPVVTDVTAQDYEMPPLPKARVILTDAYGGKHVVDTEVAATANARTRGLMWRTSLPEGTGMLFLFPHQYGLTFWMKNTLIPLDMIFIDESFTIVGIVERAEPKSLQSRGPGAPSKYVLEVPGGWSEKIGLKAGLKVELQGTADIRVQ
ncbi:MAG: DUF192 domain-containing protein [Myxococcota bacterium]